MSVKHIIATRSHMAYATALTREGVSSPSQLSPEGQEEFFKNRKPRRQKGHSTCDPTTHKNGGKVNRKILAKLFARQSSRTTTLSTNKNATEAGYAMPGSRHSA